MTFFHISIVNFFDSLSIEMDLLIKSHFYYLWNVNEKVISLKSAKLSYWLSFWNYLVYAYSDFNTHFLLMLILTKLKKHQATEKKGWREGLGRVSISLLFKWNN